MNQLVLPVVGENCRVVPTHREAALHRLNYLNHWLLLCDMYWRVLQTLFVVALFVAEKDLPDGRANNQSFRMVNHPSMAGVVHWEVSGRLVERVGQTLEWVPFLLALHLLKFVTFENAFSYASHEGRVVGLKRDLKNVSHVARDLDWRKTSHGVHLPITEVGIVSSPSWERDKCLRLDTWAESNRGPLFDRSVVEGEGFFLFLRNHIVNENGWFFGLDSTGKKPLHGRKRDAREATVALHSLKICLSFIRQRVAYNIIACWVNDPGVIDEIDVVADVAVEPENVFELDLLRRLQCGDH